MDRNGYIALFAVVALAVAGGYLAYTQLVQPKGIVSVSSEIHNLEVNSEGNVVGGYWLLSFNVRDEDVYFTSQPSEQVDPSRIAGIAGGKDVEVKANNAIRARLTQDAAFQTGPVQKVRYAFNDGLGGTRKWSYYSIATPDWYADGTHVAYNAKITNETTGSTLVDDTFLIGNTGYDDASASYKFKNSRIKIKNLGQILSGYTAPDADKAYMWWSDTRSGYIRESSISRHLPEDGTLQRSSVDSDFTNAKVVQDAPGLNISVSQDEVKVDQEPSGLSNDKHMRITPVRSYDDGRVKFYWKASEQTFSKQNITVKVKMDAFTDTGFKPDYVNVLSSDSYGGRMVAPTGTTRGLNNYLRLYFSDSTGGADKSGYFTLRFIDYTTKTKNFIKRTQLSNESRVSRWETNFVTSPSELSSNAGEYIDPWRPLFDPARMNLYDYSLPRTNFKPGTFNSVPATLNGQNVTAVWKAPPGSLNAFVQLKVPVEYFNTVINIPGNGDPDILKDQYTLDITGGKDSTLSFDVKNVGQWHDEFVVSSIGTPDNILARGGGKIQLDKGETGTFTISASSGIQNSERQTTTEFKVRALSSGKTDTAKINWQIHPGGGEPGKKADVTVSVTDKNWNPIKGATVTLSGREKITPSSGEVTFKDIPTGQQKVTVRHPDYDTVTKKPYVSSPGITVQVHMSEKGGGLPWLLILSVVTAVGATAGVLYWKRKEVLR